MHMVLVNVSIQNLFHISLFCIKDFNTFLVKTLQMVTFGVKSTLVLPSANPHLASSVSLA